MKFLFKCLVVSFSVLIQMDYSNDSLIATEDQQG